MLNNLLYSSHPAVADVFINSHNSLPSAKRDSGTSPDAFRKQLKTYLTDVDWHRPATSINILTELNWKRLCQVRQPLDVSLLQLLCIHVAWTMKQWTKSYFWDLYLQVEVIYPLLSTRLKHWKKNGKYYYYYYYY